MSSLDVLFIGVGSIAKRHIRNLAALCREQGRECNIDIVRSGHGQQIPGEVAALVRTEYHAPEEVPAGYEIVFITNPTQLHLQALQEYQAKGRNFFIEKPLVDRGQLGELAAASLKIPGIAYVACPLRYTGVIRYLKEHINPAAVHAVRVMSSSYLPDWRPGQDYRETYSAHRALGGGVSIDLIHEWDYLQYLFGAPLEVKSFIGQVSQLEVDSDDLAVYIARYPHMFAELHLDYFGRSTRRQMEIYLEDDTVIGDLEQGTVTYLRSGRTVGLAENRDAYQRRELAYFLFLLEHPGQQYNDMETAAATLRLAMGLDVPEDGSGKEGEQ